MRGDQRWAWRAPVLMWSGSKAALTGTSGLVAVPRRPAPRSRRSASDSTAVVLLHGLSEGSCSDHLDALQDTGGVAAEGVAAVHERVVVGDDDVAAAPLVGVAVLLAMQPLREIGT